jgi:hypothetical protein
LFEKNASFSKNAGTPGVFFRRREDSAPVIRIKG